MCERIYIVIVGAVRKARRAAYEPFHPGRNEWVGKIHVARFHLGRCGVGPAFLAALGFDGNQTGNPAVQANFVELRRITSELADVEAALAAAEDAWLSLEERAP